MILAILQARMSSTRLPGKVMAPILDRPMLLRQLERVGRAKSFDKLLVATSSCSSDDVIARVCADHAIECFRGSLHDVLDRFVQAARPYTPEHLVRLTADCPLADPDVIDRVVEHHLEGVFDYTSNTRIRTFQHGLDVEACRYACLEQAWREASEPFEREHVMPHLWGSERFHIGQVRQESDYSLLRWTVDFAEDLELVREIYAALYPANPTFTTDDIMRLLRDRPVLATLNAARCRHATPGKFDGATNNSVRDDNASARNVRETVPKSAGGDVV